MNKGTLYCIGLGALMVILFALNLLMGSIRIPAADVIAILMGDEAQKSSWRFIILESSVSTAAQALAWPS